MWTIRKPQPGNFKYKIWICGSFMYVHATCLNSTQKIISLLQAWEFQEFQTFHTLIDSDVKRSWINCLWQTNKKAKVKTKPTRRWTYCDKALLYVNLKSWSMPLLPSISFNFCSYPKFIAFLTRRWKILCVLSGLEEGFCCCYSLFFIVFNDGITRK